MGEIEDKRGTSWQARCIRATKGNQSRMGCILMAVIGVSAQNPPMISLHRGAVITADGYVVADMMLKGQTKFFATILGTVTEIRDNFRGLADVAKLTDDERNEMFVELRKWLSTDLRTHATVKDRIH